MIASSTTNPSTRMNANSDIRLIETPRPGISQIAPRKLMGIPRLTQKARRRRRKERQAEEHQREADAAVTQQAGRADRAGPSTGLATS